MRARRRNCTLSFGLPWDVSFVLLGLISCRPVLRCVLALWNCIPQSTEHYPSRHPAGVKTPHFGERPSLALPVQTLATPMASFLRSTTGAGTPGHIPLWLKPLQLRKRRTPTDRVDCESRKHKSDPENAPWSSAGSCWVAPLSTAHARSQSLRLHRPACKATVTGRTASLFSREEEGGGGTGLGALPRKQFWDLWLPLR